jgi:hypothetical protein
MKTYVVIHYMSGVKSIKYVGQSIREAKRIRSKCDVSSLADYCDIQVWRKGICATYIY